MHSFDAETALTRLDDGLFAGQIAPNWQVGRGPNGGYVAALVLRALTLAVNDPLRAPRSLTIHYLAPPAVGPYQIETRIERSGRSLTSLSSRLVQDGRTCALALAAFAVPYGGPTLAESAMPAVAPVEALAAVVPTSGVVPPFAAHYDYRWALGDPPFSGSASARLGGWMRFVEPREADALALAAYCDAWLPTVYPRLRRPVPAPTIDLTIHFRTSLPLAESHPDDYYLCIFSSRLIREGFFEEDGEIWSRDGQLLAQSRQLALLPGLTTSEPS